MVIFDTAHAEKAGRIAMRDAIVRDLDNRIATIAESLKTAKHATQERIALQVLQRGLQVARAEYSLWEV
jgi:hypothetical protein